jgi:hypothetical protein
MLHAIFGRNVNVANIHGDGLLHVLAEMGDASAQTVDALLKIRIQTNTGARPLFDATFRNRNHETSLDVAMRSSKRSKAVIQVLRKYGHDDSDDDELVKISEN